MLKTNILILTALLLLTAANFAAAGDKADQPLSIETLKTMKKEGVQPLFANQDLLRHPVAVVRDSARSRYLVIDAYYEGYYPDKFEKKDNNDTPLIENDSGFVLSYNPVTQAFDSVPGIKIKSPSHGIVVQDTLYITTYNKLIAFNLQTNSKIFEIKDTSVVNTNFTDIVYDKSSNFYIVAEFSSSIYKYELGSRALTKLSITGDTLMMPCGAEFITDSNNTGKLLLVSYRKKAPIQLLNLSNNILSTLFQTDYQMIDVVEGKDKYYISAYDYYVKTNQNILSIDKNLSGTFTPLNLNYDNFRAPKGMCYDKDRDWLYVASPFQLSGFSIVPIYPKIRGIFPPDSSTNVEHVPVLICSSYSPSVYFHFEVSSDSTFTIKEQKLTTKDTIFPIQYSIKNKTIYYWRVRLTNDYIYGPWSDVCSFKTATFTPNGPTPLYPLKNDSIKVYPVVNFRWDSVPNCGGYYIDYVYSSVKDTNRYVLKVSSNSITIEIEPNAKCYWMVKANYPNGTKWTNLIKFYTKDVSLASTTMTYPQNNAVNCENNIEFKWDSVPRATKYKLRYKISQGTYQYKETNTNSVRVDSLQLSGVYNWSVKAYNDTEVGQYPNDYTFTVADTVVPPPITLPQPNGDNNVSLNPTLEWSNVSAMNYNLQIATASKKKLLNHILADENEVPDFNNPVVSIDNIEGNNYKVTKTLEKNKVYFWRVQAVTKNSNSAWTPPHKFTTGDGSVSVDDRIPSQSKFEIYPNPVEGSAIIFARNMKKDIQCLSNIGCLLSISNIFGQEVVNFNLSNQNETFVYNWDVRDLSAGVYFVKLTIEGRSQVVKVIVK